VFLAVGQMESVLRARRVPLVSTLLLRVLRTPGSSATVPSGRAHQSCLIWETSAWPLSVSWTILARLSVGAGSRRMWPEASSHGAGGSHAAALAAGNGLVFLVVAALGLAVATAGLLLRRARGDIRRS
jgi:hypothetical protein